jgi:RHS repeat-associated protein
LDNIFNHHNIITILVFTLPLNVPMPNRNVVGDYRYAYQGQEKDSETGKEAFELRLWDSRIGRWLSPDPYGEFSSPYIGMGNNPITTIDIDGGRIYVTNKAGIVYEYKNGNLYDKNGNVFSGDDKFLNATRAALGKLDYATSSYVINDGKIENIGVIHKLVKSDDIYSIVYERGAHRTGGRIYIDNKATVSTPTTAGIKKSPYEITLAHELGHLYSKNNGFYNGNKWVHIPGARKPSSFDENFASHWENMFRSALDLPLRTHYGVLDGKPYEPSKLFWPRGLFFHKPVSTIAPKPVVTLQVGPLIQGEIEH